MLETRDLVKNYWVGREAIHAVDGVSLSVAAGEFVALYGPSGSGKSTLIDLVAGFQAPDQGTVLVDGRDITKLSENEHAEYLLRVLGIVGQPSELMPAQALATEPRLVLADEPTGNLDTRRSREVLGLIRSLCRDRNTAVLLATHHPQAVGFAGLV